MRNYLILLSILIISSCSFAQPGQWHTKSKKAIKYVEEAMHIASSEVDPKTGRPSYNKAIQYVDKAISKDPLFSDAYFLKAEYNMRMGRAIEAIEAYQTLVQIEGFSTSTGYVYYDLAALEMSEGMYVEALEHATKYAGYKKAPADMLAENAWMIKTCQFAIEAIKHPVPFKPVNVGSGVNTSDPEYFPTLTVEQDKLLFTRRVTSIGGNWQEDFFISPDLEGYWGTGLPMPKNINTAFNEGAPTFAPDGRTLIFVGCAIDGVGYGNGRRGYGSCDLFITKKVGKDWMDPINLPGEVNTQHWETQPSLSSDGKTLYFVRGTIRGSGGRNKRNGDIFVARLQENGAWGKAERLPPNINTKYSESSVLIHPDGKTLYFSSNGHLGMGGYDLYMTTLQDDSTWSNPKNLGYPINTHNDENSLLVYADGKLAVFASDRPGGMGSLDLYQFEMDESIQPTKTIYMTGTVFDIMTNKKLEAEFILKDLETGKVVISSTSDRIDGSFVVTLPINKDYALSVNKNGYLPYSINFNLTIPENSEEPYHIDIPLQPLHTSSEEGHILANVFFDLDSDNLRPESYVELNDFADFLIKHPKMVIELQGHTDAQGNDAHNLDLSKRRAAAVHKYLVTRGVDASKMTHEGYGETQPSKFTQDGKEIIRTEEWINALPTSKEQRNAHQQNRRTVYVVKS